MDTRVSGVRTASASSGRLRCWPESLIFGLGVPAAFWAITKSFQIPSPRRFTALLGSASCFGLLEV